MKLENIVFLLRLFAHLAIPDTHRSTRVSRAAIFAPRVRLLPLLGAKSCEACPAGQYAANEGATECLVCEAGTYAAGSGNGECQNCVSGSFSAPGAGGCESCPSGKKAESAGSEICDDCEAGRYSPWRIECVFSM